MNTPKQLKDYKLAEAIETVEVDAELSETSENPVQNKVIKKAMEIGSIRTMLPMLNSVSNGKTVVFCDDEGDAPDSGLSYFDVGSTECYKSNLNSGNFRCIIHVKDDKDGYDIDEFLTVDYWRGDSATPDNQVTIGLYRSSDGKVWEKVRDFVTEEGTYAWPSNAIIAYDYDNHQYIVSLYQTHRAIVSQIDIDYSNLFYYTNDLNGEWKIFKKPSRGSSNEIPYNRPGFSGEEMGPDNICSSNGKLYMHRGYSKGVVNVFKFTNSEYVYDSSIYVCDDDKWVTMTSGEALDKPNLMVAMNDKVYIGLYTISFSGICEINENTNNYYEIKPAREIFRSICTLNGKVYVGTRDKNLYCLDLTNPSTVSTPIKSFDGKVESIMSVDNSLYLNLRGDNGTLVKFNPETYETEEICTTRQITRKNYFDQLNKIGDYISDITPLVDSSDTKTICNALNKIIKVLGEIKNL